VVRLSRWQHSLIYFVKPFDRKTKNFQASS
jgi:hypothetical protein